MGIRKLLFYVGLMVFCFELFASNDDFERTVSVEKSSYQIKAFMNYSKNCDLQIKTRSNSSLISISNFGACDLIEVKPDLYLDELSNFIGKVLKHEEANSIFEGKLFVELKFHHIVANWHLINELNVSEFWPPNKSTLSNSKIYKGLLYTELKKSDFSRSVIHAFSEVGCNIALSKNFADANFIEPQLVDKKQLLEWNIALTTGDISKDFYPNLKGGITYDLKPCDR